MATKAGDKIQTTKALKESGVFQAAGKPGRMMVEIGLGEILVAATDELGGNIWAAYTPSNGQGVLVALAEGEWKPYP